LQRKTNELATQQDWTATRQVIGLKAAVRFTKNSYEAVRYLAADTPEDYKRKPNYILVTPTINRQLLDLLFTLVYMFDDYPNRALEYERAGWRESVEEYNRLRARFGKDPTRIGLTFSRDGKWRWIQWQTMWASRQNRKVI
jgi:hypothetical protein